MKAVHIKVYCKNCGKLLLHERVELPDQSDPKNPLRQYIGLEVETCLDCIGSGNWDV